MISNIVAAFGKVVTCVETQPPQQQQQMWTAQVQFESVSSAFCLVTAANLNGLVLGNLVRVHSIVDPVVPIPRKNTSSSNAMLSSSSDSNSRKGIKASTTAPMKCLILQNMVTLEEVQTDTSLERVIAREAALHGILLSVDFVRRKHRDGKEEAIVSLTYEDEKGAYNAWTVLNGRFFAGRQIVATLSE